MRIWYTCEQNCPSFGVRDGLDVNVKGLLEKQYKQIVLMKVGLVCKICF